MKNIKLSEYLDNKHFKTEFDKQQFSLTFGDFECSKKLFEILFEENDYVLFKKVTYRLSIYFQLIKSIEKNKHFEYLSKMVLKDCISKLQQDEKINKSKVLSYCINVMKALYKNKIKK